MQHKQKGDIMEFNEFKDRLFDLLNDTDTLPITDIITNDRKNEIKLLMDDHSLFTINCIHSGKWFLHCLERQR